MTCDYTENGVRCGNIEVIYKYRINKSKTDDRIIHLCDEHSDKEISYYAMKTIENMFPEIYGVIKC